MKTQHRVLLTENANEFHAEIALVEVDSESGAYRRVGDAEVLEGDSVTDLKAKWKVAERHFGGNA